MAQALEEVKADALLLRVHGNDVLHAVGVLAGVAPGTHALGEIEADLALGVIGGKVQVARAGRVHAACDVRAWNLEEGRASLLRPSI